MVKPSVTPGASPATDTQATPRAAWDDAALLNEYIVSQDQDAFGQIAARYGAMVFRACLRRLGNVHDAEDATQAVFLVLARQPRRATGFLAGWLHKVAQDTAITLLRSKARRAKREEAVAMRKSESQPQTLEGLREELDTTIARLPTRLREPVILCYLEGRRQDEAARLLGCNQGTLSRRAADGLNLLRGLLQRRGVVVSSAALVAFLAQQQAQAAASAALLGSLKLAAAAPAVAAGALSAQASSLADATLKAAALAKAKVAVGTLVAVALTAGAVYLSLPPSLGPRIALVNFDGTALPVNKVGVGYPSPCQDGNEPDGGGFFATRLNSADAVSGNSLQMTLNQGRFKAQFDPDSPGKKTFARDFVGDPAKWHFNTYNRLRFWIKTPASARSLATNGGANMGVGAYAKRVTDADRFSLNGGGGSFYHTLNVPNLGNWTQVVLNMHPSHRMGDNAGSDVGNLPHPTNEEAYNYFDALTRFFIEDRNVPAQYPANYFLDEVEFYQERQPENDEQVYGLTGTHLPRKNRIVATWNRNKNEDRVKHEVRYAFKNIHEIGWQAAEPAPKGTINPRGTGEANGMIYDTTEVPLSGQSVLYLAIKPENATAFTQLAIPLNLK